jgi:hypothetical protein
MALKLNITDTQTGSAFTNAYARIKGFTGDKTSVKYIVEIHATAQARLDNKRPVVRQSFTLDSTSFNGDVLPLLYANLKTQLGYESAEDC